MPTELKVIIAVLLIANIPGALYAFIGWLCGAPSGIVNPSDMDRER